MPFKNDLFPEPPYRAAATRAGEGESGPSAVHDF